MHTLNPHVHRLALWVWVQRLGVAECFEPFEVVQCKFHACWWRIHHLLDSGRAPNDYHMQSSPASPCLRLNNPLSNRNHVAE